jgi:hypothetical protein
MPVIQLDDVEHTRIVDFLDSCSESRKGCNGCPFLYDCVCLYDAFVSQGKVNSQYFRKQFLGMKGIDTYS